MMFFNEARYARQALANCLVRVGEAPVWIEDINEDFSTSFYYPMNGKRSDIADITKVKDLNVEPVPLGYINIGTQASYCKRVPCRRWKQGLSRESLDIRAMGINILKTKNFSNCILGKYPSLPKSLDLLGERQTSIAFERSWAVQVGIVEPSLLYKGKYVGIVKDGRPVLVDKFDYLKEILEEIVNEHCGQAV